jgi:hypothetical protein
MAEKLSWIVKPICTFYEKSVTLCCWRLLDQICFDASLTVSSDRKLKFWRPDELLVLLGAHLSEIQVPYGSLR